MLTPPSNLINQLIVIGLTVFGGLYVYRSIETRLISLEDRVRYLETAKSFVGGNQ